MERASNTPRPMVSTAIRPLFFNDEGRDLERAQPTDGGRPQWGLSALLPVRPAAAARSAEIRPNHYSLPTPGASPIGPQHLRSVSSSSEQQAGLPSPTCSDPTHDTACLLVRRTELRHKKAWIRKRGGSVFGERKTSLGVKCFACIVCTTVLIAILGTYVGLLLTNDGLSTATHITFILLLILTSILFIYSLLRLCLASMSPNHHNRSLTPSMQDPRLHSTDRGRNHHRHKRHRRHRPRRLNHPDLPTGADALPEDDSLYTPTTPVRVFLVSDENILNEKRAFPPSPPGDRGNNDPSNQINSNNPANVEPVTVPPPAYGLWRCSVRADPNLLHWQRSPTRETSGNANVAGAGAANGSGSERPQTANRPPSYVSAHDGNGHGDVAPGNHAENGADEVSIGGGGVAEEEWPLRGANEAVQEATRMLMRE